MDKATLQHALDVIGAFLLGLMPAALGAAVSLAYEKGLTWGDRFVQFSVGVIVSWFATRAVGAIMQLDPFVLQGVAFTLGMIAFKAAPGFVSSSAAVLAELPAQIRDRLLPRRKDP
ncbi:MAG TPA: hypothetical protein VFO80_02560 [Sphingomonas sp.]|nr:hypothetical protein [Sphingomonas sp.]